MTTIWFADIFADGKRCFMFNPIGRHKHLTVHTEVGQKGVIKEINLIQSNWDKIGTVRKI